MKTPRALQERSPRDSAEWERYYDLRWRVLREPWGQPRGSERDSLDIEAVHVAFWDDDGRPVAAGRLHLNSPTEAQVRYMVVEANYRGEKLGSRVLEILEARAAAAGVEHVVLNAREEAAPFYLRHGYQEIGSAGLLFGSIPHLKMRKQLR